VGVREVNREQRLIFCDFELVYLMKWLVKRHRHASLFKMQELRIVLSAEEENVGIINQVRKSIKFHYVRESLNVFTGDDTYSITKWIEHLEEMSDVCGWSDVELFIYGIRLLSGTVALYLHIKTGIKSWTLLRKCLMNEFRNNLTSTDGQLKAKVNYNECHQQYLFEMMEIAKQGDVSEDSLLDNIIAGIQNSEVNKSCFKRL